MGWKKWTHGHLCNYVFQHCKIFQHQALIYCVFTRQMHLPLMHTDGKQISSVFIMVSGSDFLNRKTVVFYFGTALLLCRKFRSFDAYKNSAHGFLFIGPIIHGYLLRIYAYVPTSKNLRNTLVQNRQIRPQVDQCFICNDTTLLAWPQDNKMRALLPLFGS